MSTILIDMMDVLADLTGGFLNGYNKVNAWKQKHRNGSEITTQIKLADGSSQDVPVKVRMMRLSEINKLSNPELVPKVEYSNEPLASGGQARVPTAFHQILPVEDFEVLPREQHVKRKIQDNYLPLDLNKLTRTLFMTPGFYENLGILPGAKSAVNEMIEKGHDVKLCSSVVTWANYNERANWVRRELGFDPKGKEWERRLHLMRDKTYHKGDFLIEDNAEVSGANKPDWQLVLFEQPHNKQVSGVPRIKSWTDSSWRETLQI